MYDRHKPIIKWYEYDATKLYKTVETEAEQTDEAVPVEVADEMLKTDNSMDPDMDAEVARIMAAFADAKQNSVDSVFASMNGI